jgi:hypothetical protein
MVTMEGILNSKLFGEFGFGLYASGASLNALAIKNRVLQIREQSTNRSSHGVGTFYSAGINFTALSALSWHRFLEADLNAVNIAVLNAGVYYGVFSRGVK